jgi:iron(III) transport system substrate-binding protein
VSAGTEPTEPAVLAAALKRTLAGQSITVYSGQHEQTTKGLVADFTRATGISVSLKSDDEAALAGQLLTEGTASPADVFYAENPPALTAVDAKGLLAPVDPGTLAQVPAQESATDHKWVAVSARTAAFVANTKVTQDQLPGSVYDLAGPNWKGRLGIAPQESDFSPIVTEVMKSKGAEAARIWLTGLKTNAKVYDDNEALIAAVDSGEVDGGVVDHYYWYRLRDERGADKIASALHYFPVGDPGAFADVSGAAVLSSSKHPQAAQAFLAYLVSEVGQRLIAASQSYEYPLRPGITSKEELKPLDQVARPAAPSDLGDGKDALELLKQVGLI